MQNDDRQEELERKIAEAVALAQSVVEDNERESHAENGNTDSPETEAVMTEPGGERKKLLWKVVLGVSSVVLLVCICLIVRYAFAHNRSDRANRTLREYVDYGTDGATESDASPKQDAGIDDVIFPHVKVDFDELQKKNQDICAWIYIPGTDVDYAVLQGSDNSYYLSHDAYGEYSPDGAIFIDSANSRGFSDFDTVMYGHNMSSGTMFKTLHNYEDEEFLRNNRNVYVYTPNSTLCYTVFAAYRTNDRHIFTYNDFSDKKGRRSYIDGIFDENFDTGVVQNDQKIDVDSRLLTLSTCCGMDGKRWIVQSVLTGEIEADAR